MDTPKYTHFEGDTLIHPNFLQNKPLQYKKLLPTVCPQCNRFFKVKVGDGYIFPVDKEVRCPCGEIFIPSQNRVKKVKNWTTTKAKVIVEMENSNNEK